MSVRQIKKKTCPLPKKYKYVNTFTILENYWKKTDFVKNCYIVASASPQYLSISTFYFFLNNYFRRYSQGGQGAHVKKEEDF